MEDKTEKKEASSTPVDFETFVRKMGVNRMCEVINNPDFKWAMIGQNEFGYCWTMGYKGICTTIYSTDIKNEIKYWKTEAEAKNDLIDKYR